MPCTERVRLKDVYTLSPVACRLVACGGRYRAARPPRAKGCGRTSSACPFCHLVKHSSAGQLGVWRLSDVDSGTSSRKLSPRTHPKSS